LAKALEAAVMLETSSVRCRIPRAEPLTDNPAMQAERPLSRSVAAIFAPHFDYRSGARIVDPQLRAWIWNEEKGKFCPLSLLIQGAAVVRRCGLRYGSRNGRKSAAMKRDKGLSLAIVDYCIGFARGDRQS